MKTAVLGLLVLVGLVVSVVGICSQRNSAFAQNPADYPSFQDKASEQLIAFSVQDGEGNQQVTLIDPVGRAMSVYHIETASGEITLRSVRRFHWDLQMEEFNGTSPSPRDIRSLIERREGRPGCSSGLRIVVCERFNVQVFGAPTCHRVLSNFRLQPTCSA